LGSAALFVAYFFRDEAAIVTCGLLTAAAVRKVVRDFDLDKRFKYLGYGLSAAVAGFGTYLVATTNKLPEGTIISEFWKSRGEILMGVGAALGSYVYLRDKKLGNLDWKTVLKSTVGAAAVAGGLYFGGFLPALKRR
jgi:hypothetical protein